MTIAEKITQLRKATGISQEQLAGALSVSRQSVSKWERGEAAPDIDKIVALSQYFKVSCDELLLGDTAAMPEQPVWEQPATNQTNKKSGFGEESQLVWAIEQNKSLFKLKTGISLAKLAAGLAALCCVLPYAMQGFERYVYGQFYTYATEYLKHFPLPPLIALTLGVAIASACFFISAKDGEKPIRKEDEADA